MSHVLEHTTSPPSIRVAQRVRLPAAQAERSRVVPAATRGRCRAGTAQSGGRCRGCPGAAWSERGAAASGWRPPGAGRGGAAANGGGAGSAADRAGGPGRGRSGVLGGPGWGHSLWRRLARWRRCRWRRSCWGRTGPAAPISPARRRKGRTCGEPGRGDAPSAPRRPGQRAGLRRAAGRPALSRRGSLPRGAASAHLWPRAAAGLGRALVEGAPRSDGAGPWGGRARARLAGAGSGRGAGSAAGSSGRAEAASLERLLRRGDRRDGVWEAAALVLRCLSLENSGNGRKMRNTVMDCG